MPDESPGELTERVHDPLETIQWANMDDNIEALIIAAIKQKGFTQTLKDLKKRRLRTPPMMSVHEGVIQEQSTGLYDAALHTDLGRVVLTGARRTDRGTSDLQSVSSVAQPSLDPVAVPESQTPAQLLAKLMEAGGNPSPSLICEAELTRFNPMQRDELLPLLWSYISAHRSSNNRSELIGVGAAIRKYIALMPMDQMAKLSVLLEAGNRSPLPVELEIEVLKMVCRNFEVHAPVAADTQPQLADRLWEIARTYLSPRILVRDKYSAAASLAINALIAMRSSLAAQAWAAAQLSPYRWFTELVTDDLDRLQVQWRDRTPEAAAWLANLKNTVVSS